MRGRHARMAVLATPPSSCPTQRSGTPSRAGRPDSGSNPAGHAPTRDRAAAALRHTGCARWRRTGGCGPRAARPLGTAQSSTQTPSRCARARRSTATAGVRQQPCRAPPAAACQEPTAACKHTLGSSSSSSRVRSAALLDTRSRHMHASALCARAQVRDTVTGTLALLRANHPEDCMSCDVNGKCEFQDLINRYQVRGMVGGWGWRRRRGRHAVLCRRLVPTAQPASRQHACERAALG